MGVVNSHVTVVSGLVAVVNSHVSTHVARVNSHVTVASGRDAVVSGHVTVVISRMEVLSSCLTDFRSLLRAICMSLWTVVSR